MNKSSPMLDCTVHTDMWITQLKFQPIILINVH